MSYLTFSKIPKHIQQFLTLYEYCSSLNNPVPVKYSRDYLKRQSKQHQTFVRQKLMSGTSELGSDDYPYIFRQALRPLFQGKFVVDELESLSTEDLFKDEYNASKTPGWKQNLGLTTTHRVSPIVSRSNLNHVKFPKFHANLIKSFASFLRPLRTLPNEETFKNRFTWFNRLLEDTPVVIFLKQRNRLFSDATVSQINFPFNELNRQISQLAMDFPSSRSYHLTEFVDLDVFRLSVKFRQENVGAQEMSVESGIDTTKRENASSVEAKASKPDELCDELMRLKDIQLLKDNQVCTGIWPDVFKEYPMKSLKKHVGLGPLREVFPYDLEYNEYFILTIEQPILTDNHESLSEILTRFNGQFDIAAIRLALSDLGEPKQGTEEKVEDSRVVGDSKDLEKAKVNETNVNEAKDIETKVIEETNDIEVENKSKEAKDTQQTNDRQDIRETETFDHILESASKTDPNVHSLLQRFGEMGVTRAVTKPDCIYLFSQS